MAALMNAHSDSIASVAGIKTQVRRSGRGAPLLVIHGELGMPGWTESLSILSETHDVIVPSLPGYDGSERPDWIMSVHDLAAWITWFARDSGIASPVNVIGCSLGGWVAAEIATIAPQFFNRMALVSPMGIKPQQGEIFDYFLENGLTGIRRNFHAPESSAEYLRYFGKDLSPEEADLIEQHREMTCRIVWKPYMHSLTLPALLSAITTPTLILRGDEDRITPPNCSDIYHRSIKGSKLAAIGQCGHMPEMEKPVEFARAINAFMTA